MLYNVKAGIIGLEDLGVQFAHLIKDHVKNLNLMAACGRNQKELLFAKNDLSLEYVYSDEKALFENHDIDVIFIFSELHLRAHYAIQALEAGKHVYIVSPIALNVEDAKAVLKCANSHPSQHVMVGSKVRFAPIFQLLKQTIDNKSIGKIRHITIDSDFVSSLNKQFGKPTGSVFLDEITDEIDLCLYLQDATYNKINVRVNGETLLCQAESTQGPYINLTLQPKVSKKESYLNIFGDNGHISVSNKNQQSFNIIDAEGVKSEVALDADQQFLYSEYLQLHNFTKAILENDRSRLTLNHAADIMELSLAFEKSKVLGEVILLD